MTQAMPLLLDTHAVVWLALEQPIADAAQRAIQESHETGAVVYVSPMSAWEIGLLFARGRLISPMAPLRWFERVLDAPGIQLAELSASILIASSFLPGTPPRDPVDRILAATARESGYRLVTHDRALLAYAAEGHLHAVTC